MAIDDVYTITVRSTWSGQVYMNKLAFVRTEAADVDATQLLGVANAIKEIHRPSQITTFAYTTWEARQVRGANVTYPSGTNCQPEGGLYFDGAMTGSLAGAVAAEALPPQCAMVTTLRTGQIGRRKRGRFYAPGWGELQQDGG